MLPLDAIAPLILFTALLLALSLLALTACGHFPAEHRAPAVASGFGLVLLYGAIALTLLSLLAGLFAAWRLIPWYAAVIGGGVSILMAPLLLQKFPDSFVDGRRSLAIFGGISIVLALLLLVLARP